ncbi:uncharacterized protein LOC143362256 [Halictus rubicundus]|uniref:uncharacterized protein LOC143362256 n=1 Tax=Halictus rubicundus TaxID=77578 RepID=UPI004036CC3E
MARLTIKLIFTNADWSQFPEIAGTSNPIPPSWREVFHHILTKGPPISSRARRLAPEKLCAAKQKFNLWCEAGICRPSSSPRASPTHMVQKKDETWRVWESFEKENILFFRFAQSVQIPVTPEDVQNRDHNLLRTLSFCTLTTYSWLLQLRRSIRSLANKGEVIINFSKPKTVVELRRFLGMTNFYYRNLP